MIDRGLGRAHRRQQGLGPRRRFGIRHEAAIVQLDRRGVEELPRVEEGAHQGVAGWRPLGRNGSDNIRPMRDQRVTASVVPPHSMNRATRSRPSP